MRYVRAFFKAWWLVLRGQAIQPPPPVHPYPLLEEWRTMTLKRLETVYRIAEKAQTDFKRVGVRVDKRDMTAETILGAVRHNLTLEYPLLIASQLEFSLTTLYSLNLNDVYRVGELAKTESLQNTPLGNALFALSQQLNAIPPQEALSKSL